MRHLTSAIPWHRLFVCSISVVLAVGGAAVAVRAEQLVASPKITVNTSASAIEIKLDAPHPHTLNLLTDPPRAVIDFEGIVIPKPKHLDLSNHPLFKAIRVGRHSGFTRVVIDLIEGTNSSPHISSHGGTVRVDFKNSSADVPVSERTQEPSLLPAPTPPRVLSVTRLLPSATPTSVATATFMPSPSPTATPSATPSLAPSPTLTATTTFTPAFTNTPQPTATHTQTALPTVTSTTTPPPTASPTCTPSPSQTPTQSPSATPTEIASISPTIELSKVAPKSNEPTESPAPEVPLGDTELKFSVSALVVNLPYNGRGVQDVVVRNRSDRPLFMKATALRVINPGGSPESLTPTTELLVSPRRLTLEQGQERTIRLVVAKRTSDAEESVYRVQLIPDAEPFENQAEGQQLRVSTGLALLVTVGPKNPKTSVQPHWRKNTLVLENKGNVNVLLERGQSCFKGQCATIPSRRLYPGARWEIPLKRADSVEFLQRSGDEFERLVIAKE